MIDSLPPECDELCRFRSCLHPGENKGPYVPGRGYTGYYTAPEPVCMTRHLHGCPTGTELDGKDLRPLPDPEKLTGHLQREIDEARATLKVKRLMRAMLEVIRLLSKHAAAGVKS
ncbi:MAG: hypothetical protein RBS57_18970 [Desulforhabdus sp.]|jgi:hypothetical protein|nr:hypothetical protein [Desulforhabdus sp.]